MDRPYPPRTRYNYSSGWERDRVMEVVVTENLQKDRLVGVTVLPDWLITHGRKSKHRYRVLQPVGCSI